MEHTCQDGAHLLTVLWPEWPPRTTKCINDNLIQLDRPAIPEEEAQQAELPATVMMTVLKHESALTRAQLHTLSYEYVKSKLKLQNLDNRVPKVGNWL